MGGRLCARLAYLFAGGARPMVEPALRVGAALAGRVLTVSDDEAFEERGQGVM